MATTTPQECAVRAEAAADMPPDPAEHFAGYAVLGVPLSSGHYLAFRCFPSSSIGPGYRAVWLRTPAGQWTVYADVPPEQSCARYFGAALAQAVTARVDAEWAGPRALKVGVPGVVSWELELGVSWATAAATAAALRLPSAVWRRDGVVNAMGRMMGPALGAGRMKLAGLVPNGQRFQARPLRLWTVTHSRAVIGGEDAGILRVLPGQEHLADFWLPRRGLFVADVGIRFPSTAAHAGSRKGGKTP
ncbi:MULTISPECIES: hypothetical protein [unclassified Arthrobacter]|uniref:hypothetical protein n=1 Tax=unclassified Arthrobacter TaxID=235627 RepID=UPI00159D621F|nr:MULTISPECIES: hypothetical protein [unclassified Arthrobacter]MCQ9163151.1 hypothetical protein [Arthrobacter sp. STN4]NVM99664.1 hypothetical protein [Arthrobacter sp. SDTb3-6]